MAAACVGPLVIPLHYDPSLKVNVRLHEPLFHKQETPEDIELQIISLCSQLDLLCKQEINGQSLGRVEHGRVSSSFSNKVIMVTDKLHHLLPKVAPHQNLHQHLCQKGLDQVFPRAAAYLQNPEGFSLGDNKTCTDGYFSELMLMNQVYGLALQMNSDLHNLSDHKYMAHQLAILYQSVTAGNQQCMKAFKKSIEDNFKVVKAHLSSEEDGPKVMLPEHKEWLLGLTYNIIQTVTSFPAEMTKDIVTTAGVLQRL